MTERMRNYIREVIRLLHESWPGLLSAMDVVNEAVNDNGTFRTSSNEWYAIFGDASYVMKAFEFARQAAAEYGESQIKLYYNDYNTSTATKADGIVALVQPIFQAGYLDGIGMQEHDQYNSPTATQWIASYNKFDAVCTEMSVTEFDINPGGSLTPEVLARQANQYGMLAKCFVERSARSGRGKIVSVSKDGLNDQWAFVANASLWDTQNKCKPSLFAVVHVGLNYNALDSLIAIADTLQEGDYTSGSWSAFSAVLSSATAARDQNYSNTVSADTALGDAKTELQAALDGLILVGIAGGRENTPVSFELSQNYPNPFNPNTQIRYSIPERGHVSLKVYNLVGDEVATIFEGTLSAGNHVAVFDGRGQASGVYFYRLTANGFAATKKLILVR
jgi:hypothetical protein